MERKCHGHRQSSFTGPRVKGVAGWTLAALPGLERVGVCSVREDKRERSRQKEVEAGRRE